MTSINRIGVDRSTLFAGRIRAITFSVSVIFLAHLSIPLWGQWPASGGSPGWTGGNVGIGTPTPANILSVEKDQYAASFIDLTNTNAGGSANIRVINDLGTSAYIGIYGSTGIPSGALVAGNPYLYTTATGLTIAVNNASGVLKFTTGGLTERVRIDPSGNVGIGTTNPQSLLAVNGKITAKEVVVTTQGFPDYVFNPDYHLTPLNQVAAYIKEHHHLPEIPSEAEVKEKGVDLGDLQVKLLAKVEELTLHMIKADERNNRSEQENRELRERIALLEAREVKADVEVRKLNGEK